MDEALVWQYVNRRATSMWAAREGLDELDRRIVRAMCPELASGYLYDVSEIGKDGVELGSKNVNPTVYECVDVASSGFQSHLTNPARKWFSLGPGNGNAEQVYGGGIEVRGWYDDATALIEKVLAASGSYNALHEAYRQLVLLGRCCILRTEDLRTVVRHTTLIPGTYAFGFDEAGEPDAVVRKFALTARECLEVYGEEVCGDALAEQARRGDEQQKCVIWQLIERHRDAAGHVLGEKCLEGLDLPEDFTYRSIHFAQRGGFKKRILRVAGFKRDPILAPRYSVSGGNLYGVGIGKRMLPSVVGLQTATRMLYEAVGQVVRPPVNAPAEMKQARITLSPGGVNYYTTTGSGQATMVSSVYASRPDLQAVQLVVAQLEQKVSRGFLNHLFMSLDQIRERSKTAYETEQVLIEARQVLGPVITVWDKELLDPLVMGVFWACVDAGLITVPDAIAQGGVSPQYLSLIHMAQRATGLNNVQAFLQIIGGVAQLDPGVLDNVDGDGTVATAASMLGVPERMLRSAADVEAMREARAQAQAQQAAMQEAAANAQIQQAQAGAIRDLGTIPNGNEIASAMIGTSV